MFWDRFLNFPIGRAPSTLCQCFSPTVRVQNVGKPSATPAGEPLVPQKRPNTKPDAVWLPALQKSLPGAWATGSVSASKAAKAGDALVQMAPWRLRIKLIFRSPNWALERLERLMMKFYRGHLFLSLLSYLQRTHGDDWKPQFLRAAVSSCRIDAVFREVGMCRLC